ncbi:MAG: SIR2 family protein [Gemmataceae bacterium]
MATHLDRLEDELVLHTDRVVIVAGIGVSLATCGTDQPCATWPGLLRHGLKTCQDECGTSAVTLAAQRAMLDDGAAPDHVLIGAGEFITQELRGHHHGRYGRWLMDTLGELRVRDTGVVRALERLGVRIATTNYDGLIEEASLRLKSPITWRQRTAVTSYFREPTPEVFHIHGHYCDPHSVVLGARSYGEVCRDQDVQDALRWQLRFGTFVFVGCGRGLVDPNFGALLEWSRTALANAEHEHFLLVSESDVESWRNRLRGLPIVPVAYGSSHGDLLPFLEGLGERVAGRRQPNTLVALAATQADFDARWDALVASRAEMPPGEFYRRLRALTETLIQAHGLHRAAMSFSGEVMYRAEGLTSAEYVEFALDAAEWLLDDDVPDLANNHLAKVGRYIHDGQIPEALVERFRALQLRGTDALCAYTETLQAITDQLAHASPAERERLEAERCEIRLLQGDFDHVAGE